MSAAKILIIDDELVMCEFLRDLLQDRGYIVNYANSGRDGLKTFKEDNYNVVMVDFKMPDINGIQVLQEVKSANSDTIVIIMTGYPSFETIQSAIREGAYDYITKPFNIEEISLVIKRAVDLQNLSFMNKRLMKELEEQNVKLEEKVKERTKELSLLFSISRDILSSIKLDEVLKTIVDRICTVLDIEKCAILLLDLNRQELSIQAARGLTEDIIRNTRIKIGESISGWIIENSEGILVEDLAQETRFTPTNKEQYYTHSFISVPLTVKNDVIGVINVNNKRSGEPFTKEDFGFIKGLTNEAAIAVENARLYTSLTETYIRTVKALTSAIDAKDHYTRNHSEHVTRYAVEIAKEMGLGEKDTENIRLACQLHDLGKIGVHDYILTKNDKLTPGEWAEIKLHPGKSAEILSPLVFLGDVIEFVKQHHERYDGQGYPTGLKGEEIKVGARIISVADSFDAMVTVRPYRETGFTKDMAMSEVKKCSGTQFDPKVVEAFLRVLDKNPELITEVQKED
ncbi:MAG: HD domain-containing phosphohydrolase [Candidatus Omnitrophota bacterium]